jgi:hypothetical protein
LLQLVPWQRSIKYATSVPPVSVEGDQVRLICVLPDGEAAKFEGAVIIGAAVVALAVVEYGPRLLAASVARTR